MTGHLQSPEIEGYLSRALDPAALLAADDHIAGCAECRSRLAASAAPIRQLRRSLAEKHLSPELIELYAEGRLSDPDARAHLNECFACRAEAEDLRKFVREGRRTRSRLPVSWLAAAAGLCAVSFGAVMLFQMRQEPRRVAVIQPALPPDLLAIKNSALQTGHVDIPPGILALRGARETQLGSPAEPQPELQSPVATAVLSGRPEFHWASLPGATQYEVFIFDESGRPAASSSVLATTSWTPPHELTAGTYFWELSGVVNGQRVTAPRPPLPQARFMVLPESEQTRLANLAARFPEDHVLLGIIDARAGALDAARRQWQAALAAGHPEAARLLAGH